MPPHARIHNPSKTSTMRSSPSPSRLVQRDGQQFPSGSPAVSIVDVLIPPDIRSGWTEAHTHRLLWLLVLVALVVACHKPSVSRTSQIASPTPTITEARKDVHDAATAIKRGADDSQEAVEAGRKSWLAYLAELTALGIESVQTSPHVPVVTKSYDDIEAANQRIVAETVKLRFVEGKLDEARRLSDAQRAEVSRLAGDVKTLTKERDDAIKSRDDAFRKRLEGWAVFAVLGAVGCGVVCGLMVWQGNVKGALGMATLGGILIACAVALYVLATWWKWIVGGVVITLGAFIGWLILSRIDRDKLRLTLSKIVPVIDEEDPTGQGIKSRIAAAAGNAGAVVKSTVTSIKQSLKQLEPV